MRSLFLALLILAAAVQMQARQVGDKDRYIPFVQNGGGWSTRITLVNLGSKPANYELAFHPVEGLLGSWPLKLQGTAASFQNATASGMISPGGMVVVETDGEGETVSTGYAALTRFDGSIIGVDAIIRDSNSSSVITLPLSPAREDVVALQYDNTEGNSTKFIWLSETDFAVADMTVYDEGGRELARKRFEFFVDNNRAQQAFDTAAQFPELKGMRGVAVIQMNYPTVGFYDEATFAAVAIQSGAKGMSASTGLTTGAWAPRRY
jgi:hypothetical protein